MSQDPESGARRSIGPASAGVLVVANMVGAGVFTTSGFALLDMERRWILFAWFAGGLLAVCGALSYGALARRFPESGGEYLFLSRMVHPMAGFVAGWISLLAGFTAPIAAAALALQAYAWPSDVTGLRPEWLGTVAILLAVGMHGVRLESGLRAQNVIVALKILSIGVLIVFGLLRISSLETPPPAASVPFDLGAFAVSLVWISFAYSGWNAAVYLAGEVRDPERNLHRSLLVSTLIVTLAYVGLNAVFLFSAPSSELAGQAEIGALAAEALGGSSLRLAVSLLISVALFTSISSMVMAGPRVYARMAEDGLFPALFTMRGQVPTAAVALQGMLAIAVLWFSGLAELFGYIGFTLGLSAAATVAGLIALRLREGAERVPVPGFPWVPLAFVATTLATAGYMVVRRPLEAGLGLLTLLAGAPLYLWMKRSQAKALVSHPPPTDATEPESPQRFVKRG